MEEFVKEMWDFDDDISVDDLVCEYYKLNINQTDWNTML